MTVAKKPSIGTKGRRVLRKQHLNHAIRRAENYHLRHCTKLGVWPIPKRKQACFSDIRERADITHVIITDLAQLGHSLLRPSTPGQEDNSATKAVLAEISATVSS